MERVESRRGNDNKPTNRGSDVIRVSKDMLQDILKQKYGDAQIELVYGDTVSTIELEDNTKEESLKAGVSGVTKKIDEASDASTISDGGQAPASDASDHINDIAVVDVVRNVVVLDDVDHDNKRDKINTEKDEQSGQNTTVPNDTKPRRLKRVAREAAKEIADSNERIQKKFTEELKSVKDELNSRVTNKFRSAEEQLNVRVTKECKNMFEIMSKRFEKIFENGALKNKEVLDTVVVTCQDLEATFKNESLKNKEVLDTVVVTCQDLEATFKTTAHEVSTTNQMYQASVARLQQLEAQQRDSCRRQALVNFSLEDVLARLHLDPAYDNVKTMNTIPVANAVDDPNMMETSDTKTMTNTSNGLNMTGTGSSNDTMMTNTASDPRPTMMNTVITSTRSMMNSVNDPNFAETRTEPIDNTSEVYNDDDEVEGVHYEAVPVEVDPELEIHWRCTMGNDADCSCGSCMRYKQ